MASRVVVGWGIVHGMAAKAPHSAIGNETPIARARALGQACLTRTIMLDRRFESAQHFLKVLLSDRQHVEKL